MGILSNVDLAKVTILQKTSMLLLAIFPIIEVYLVGHSKISYAIALGAFLIMVTFFKNKFSFRNILPIAWFFLWVYLAIHTYLIAGISGWSDYIPGGIEFVIFTIIMIVIVKNFHLDAFYYYLKIIFVIASLLFMFQLLTFYSTHIKTSVFLPLSNNLSYCNLTCGELINIQKLPSRSMVERFSSLFCEPSYFAQYNLIVLTVELFYKENKFKLFTPFAIFVALVIVLTQSGSGMLGLILIALIKLVYIIFKTKNKKYYFYILTLIPIAIVMVNYYLASEAGIHMAGRMAEIDGTMGENTSSFSRLILGWTIYDGMTLFQKIFGNTRSFMQYYWDGGFFNGVTALLCGKGLIALLLLSLAYFLGARKQDALSTALLLVFLLISLFESTYLGGLMMIISSVVYGLKYKRFVN